MLPAESTPLLAVFPTPLVVLPTVSVRPLVVSLRTLPSPLTGRLVNVARMEVRKVYGMVMVFTCAASGVSHTLCGPAHCVGRATEETFALAFRHDGWLKVN